jgi:hypothetical protein
MNNKHQENGARIDRVIFTVPAYGFVMALYLDWLDGPDRAAVSTKTHGWNCPATRPSTANFWRPGCL